MTAEVAVMNRRAVALAADSAMTVGESGAKVYNTINKVFALSKYEPVGIMVYASANLIGIPVDTFIKHYRSRILVDRRLDRLNDYAADFFAYIATDHQLLTVELRREHLVSVMGQVLRSVGNSFRKLPKKDRAKKCLQLAREAISSTKKADLLTGISKEQIKEITTLASSIADRWRLEMAESCRISKELTCQVAKYLIESLTRDGQIVFADAPIRSIETGIVVAGFGELDAYPALTSFEVVYSAFGVTKYYMKKNVRIGMSNSAAIEPFAQADQIETFLYGRPIDDDGFVAYIANKKFTDKIQDVLSAPGLTDEQRQNIETALGSIRDEVIKGFIDFLSLWRQSSAESVKETVATLPKEDLAMIAEAMISLTIAKRRASQDTETVGPPVDVAVISKGDGLIWMQRKHYFDPTLNPQFGHNYFRKVTP